MEQGQIESNLELFKELISCHANVYLWQFDSEGNLLKSNCPYETVFGTVFSVFGCKKQMYDHGRRFSMPFQLVTPLGLSWFAAFHREQGTLKQVYAIGPISTTEFSMSAIWHVINYTPELNSSAAWRRELGAALDKIPALSSLIWNQYGVMLHYCVTGKKIRISDLHRTEETHILPDGFQVHRDRHRTWLAEQNLMRAIREGDLNFRDALNRSSLVSEGVPVRAENPIRRAKDSVIVSIALCTRAAIDGGLSPEQAYSLGDAYIQAVEDTRDSLDIGRIHDTMMEDFVTRVRKMRTNPNLSKHIQTCCDYIEGHSEDDLNIDSLAQIIGYSKYYLSRQFKEEMRISINNYIKIVRVERSKSLLLTTDDSVLEIALRLKFCSRSHFSESFREIVGCTPVEYREKYGKINR